MPKATIRDPIYRGRRFPTEVIEQCVRWYISYRLSYRDLMAIMAERGVVVTHTTILRWVLRYVPEYERRWSRFARPVGSSWRMDETVVFVGGYQHWLYRAVDRYGKSVHSRLSNTRTIEAAEAFFRTAVTQSGVAWPSKINLDGNSATRQALRQLGRDDPRWRSVTLRTNRYVNNVIEQDHRAVKRRCAAALGFKSFRTAAITLLGVELAHRIRKAQYAVPGIDDRRGVSLSQCWQSALRSSNDPRFPLQANSPPMHQFSEDARHWRRQQPKRRFSRRHPLRVPYGEGLFLLVMPSGGRVWRYYYQCRGRRRTLALGAYPFVHLEQAKRRHAAARQMIKEGIDPSARRREIQYLTV